MTMREVTTPIYLTKQVRIKMNKPIKTEKCTTKIECVTDKNRSNCKLLQNLEVNVSCLFEKFQNNIQPMEFSNLEYAHLTVGNRFSQDDSVLKDNQRGHHPLIRNKWIEEVKVMMKVGKERNSNAKLKKGELNLLPESNASHPKIYGESEWYW